MNSIMVSLLFLLLLAEAPYTKELSPAERAAQRLPIPVCKAEWGDEDILCGFYEVYENREQNSGRKLSLRVTVIPSLAATPIADPIFYLEGGPGVAPSGSAYYFAKEAPYRQTRDIVLVDLRGMGASRPLHCNLIGDSTNLQNYMNEMYPVELVKECRKELEKYADLTQYTTSIMMADLNDIRKWLGYEQINIFGLSYGGRAAYVYARAYPEHVRSIYLLGPADINSKLPLYHAQLAERAFNFLFDDCRTDLSCNAAFPNIGSEFKTLVERLRKEPSQITYPHPVTGESIALLIYPDVLVENVRTMMYMPFTSRRVPWIVHNAYEGNYRPYLDHVLPSEFGRPPSLAEGAYLSITGAEDAPYISEANADSLTAGTLLGNYRVFQQKRAAALWPQGALPDDYFDTVLLDVPTLILQGGRDPVIAAGAAIKWFRNGREIIIPQMGHLDFGLSSPECMDNMVVTFLNTMDHHTLDTACIADMIPLPFTISADEEEK